VGEPEAAARSCGSSASWRLQASGNGSGGAEWIQAAVRAGAAAHERRRWSGAGALGWCRRAEQGRPGRGARERAHERDRCGTGAARSGCARALAAGAGVGVHERPRRWCAGAGLGGGKWLACGSWTDAGEQALERRGRSGSRQRGLVTLAQELELACACWRCCGGRLLREMWERGGRIEDAVKVFDEMLAAGEVKPTTGCTTH
jgi:pentatricopeptide repeat protein